MAYYVCNNEKCKNFGLHQDITREVFKYVSGKGLVGEHAACPECGEDREYVNPKAMRKMLDLVCTLQLQQSKRGKC